MTLEAINNNIIKDEYEAVGINPELFAKHRTLKEHIIICDAPKPTPIIEARRLSTRLSTKRINIEPVDDDIEPKPKRIRVSRKTTFRDKILAEVDVKNYHLEDEIALKLIDLTRFPRRAQIDRFVYGSKAYIVTVWLTTARIFECSKRGNAFAEVKRLPGRFISMSSNLITSLHYCELKFYLAYLWGSTNETYHNNRKPFMEIRDIHNQIIGKPHFYDNVVTQIYSDSNFIYALTDIDDVYIHKKNLFDCVVYHISSKLFQPYSDSPLVAVWIHSEISTNPFTKLPLLVATRKDILIIDYDTIDHNVSHCFQLKKNFSTVSVDKMDKVFILHRTLDESVRQKKISHLSELNLGWIGKTKEVRENLFIHEISLLFKYNITQIESRGDHLYLLGQMHSEIGTYCEIGCIFMPSLRPIWTTSLSNVDKDCRILVHDEFICIVKQDQQLDRVLCCTSRNKLHCKRCKISFLKREDKQNHTRSGHKSIFQNLKALQNNHLKELGSSSFKKLEKEDSI